MSLFRAFPLIDLEVGDPIGNGESKKGDRKDDNSSSIDLVRDALPVAELLASVGLSFMDATNSWKAI